MVMLSKLRLNRSSGGNSRSLRLKKAWQVRSNVKVILTVFFDFNGIVQHEFLPQGQIVNKDYNLQVQCHLCEAVQRKYPDLWQNNSKLLHHNNASSHTSLLVREFLAKNNTVMMLQLPYSPYMTPCDFFMFQKIKRTLMKGRRSTRRLKVHRRKSSKLFLRSSSRTNCFEDWKKRWHKCILSNGDYFEGITWCIE